MEDIAKTKVSVNRRSCVRGRVVLRSRLGRYVKGWSAKKPRWRMINQGQKVRCFLVRTPTPGSLRSRPLMSWAAAPQSLNDRHVEFAEESVGRPSSSRCVGGVMRDRNVCGGGRNANRHVASSWSNVETYTPGPDAKKERLRTDAF